MFATTVDAAPASAFRFLLRRSALALAASAALVGPALAGPQAMLPHPPENLARPAQWFGSDSGPSEIADILYSRYGMQRVMRIRTMGDLYRADAIDRRGYRVRVTLDGRGRMLDSFVVGSRAYDSPVPLPPRGVPGGERYRYVDPQDGTELPPPGHDRYEQRSYGQPSYDQRYARTPDGRSLEPGGANPAPDTLNRERLPSSRTPKSRQARNPDAANAPAAPRKPKAVPNLPKSEQAAPAKPAPEKPAETAARPAAPEPEATKPVTPAPMPAPAPTAVPPTTTPPVVAPEKPAAEEAPAVRQAAPAPQRIPEPLVDPKTGQPTAAAGGAVPAAPLDESSKKPETPMVPPATLE